MIPTRAAVRNRISFLDTGPGTNVVVGPEGTVVDTDGTDGLVVAGGIEGWAVFTRTLLPEPPAITGTSAAIAATPSAAIPPRTTRRRRRS